MRCPACAGAGRMVRLRKKDGWGPWIAVAPDVQLGGQLIECETCLVCGGSSDKDSAYADIRQNLQRQREVLEQDGEDAAWGV